MRLNTLTIRYGIPARTAASRYQKRPARVTFFKVEVPFATICVPEQDVRVASAQQPAFVSWASCGKWNLIHLQDAHRAVARMLLLLTRWVPNHKLICRFIRTGLGAGVITWLRRMVRVRAWWFFRDQRRRQSGHFTLRPQAACRSCGSRGGLRRKQECSFAVISILQQFLRQAADLWLSVASSAARGISIKSTCVAAAVVCRAP